MVATIPCTNGITDVRIDACDLILMQRSLWTHAASSQRSLSDNSKSIYLRRHLVISLFSKVEQDGHRVLQQESVAESRPHPPRYPRAPSNTIVWTHEVLGSDAAP